MQLVSVQSSDAQNRSRHKKGRAIMPLHGVPGSSFRVAANEEKPPINWRRGLFRVWLLVSGAWVMAWAIYLPIKGIEGGLRTVGDFVIIPLVLFGPPIALLLFGMAAGWSFRGFRV